MIILIVIIVIMVITWCCWYTECFQATKSEAIFKRPRHPQKHSDLPEDHPNVQNFYKESRANRDKTKHYDSLGYKKTKMPKAVFEYLKDVCETTDRIKEDVFPRSSSGPPPYLINIPESKKTWITNMIHPILEKWVGIPLKHEATYGPREYRKGSSLRCHVDRDEHIISAILHIGRDPKVSEGKDWGLQVTGHDGIKKEIYMEPGDLVLYESRSVMHGREKPCPYDYYRNIFVHFSPESLN